jgi:hypothetical protein
MSKEAFVSKPPLLSTKRLITDVAIEMHTPSIVGVSDVMEKCFVRRKPFARMDVAERHESAF